MAQRWQPLARRQLERRVERLWALARTSAPHRLEPLYDTLSLLLRGYGERCLRTVHSGSAVHSRPDACSQAAGAPRGAEERKPRRRRLRLRRAAPIQRELHWLRACRRCRLLCGCGGTCLLALSGDEGSSHERPRATGLVRLLAFTGRQAEAGAHLAHYMASDPCWIEGSLECAQFSNQSDLSGESADEVPGITFESNAEYAAKMEIWIACSLRAGAGRKGSPAKARPPSPRVHVKRRAARARLGARRTSFYLLRYFLSATRTEGIKRRYTRAAEPARIGRLPPLGAPGSGSALRIQPVAPRDFYATPLRAENGTTRARGRGRARHVRLPSQAAYVSTLNATSVPPQDRLCSCARRGARSRPPHPPRRQRAPAKDRAPNLGRQQHA